MYHEVPCDYHPYLLQEAFIHPTELCEACFIMELRFIWRVLDHIKETPTNCNDCI